MGSAISGKGGDIRLGTTSPVQFCEVTKWSFNPKSNNNSYASNCSGGFKRRVAGTKEGSGTVDGKWDPTAPPTDALDVGDSITLNLHYNATQKWIVPAVVDSMRIDVDMDSGDIVGWSIDFSSDGAWTKPVATAPFMGPLGRRTVGPRHDDYEAYGEMPPARPAARPARPAPAASSTRVEDAPALDVRALADAVASAVSAAILSHPALAGYHAPQQRGGRAVARAA